MSKASCRCIGYHISSYPSLLLDHLFDYSRLEEWTLNLQYMPRLLDLSQTFDYLQPGHSPSIVNVLPGANIRILSL